jgi:hypothetical protein
VHRQQVPKLPAYRASSCCGRWHRQLHLINLCSASCHPSAEAPDKTTLTELDKLAEEAATLRVGLVLGLGGGQPAAGDSDDEVRRRCNAHLARSQYSVLCSTPYGAALCVANISPPASVGLSACSTCDIRALSC